jgi:hypothetical protein
VTDQLTTTTFAVVPTWVLDHPQLSDRAVRLYGVLARYADGDQRAWPARTTLAERLRCSVDSVDRAVRELTAAGAVTVTRRYREDGQPTSNLYRLAVTAPEGVAAAVRLPGRTGAPTVAAPVRPERKPGEREPENESHNTLAPAAPPPTSEVLVVAPSEVSGQLPTRPVPGRTLTSQLVRWGLQQGHLDQRQLDAATDRVDVHRLALRLAEQQTEGTTATRVAQHLALEYLGAVLPDAEVTPAARRLLSRLVTATTPASLLRYLDLAVRAGAGLREQDTDELLAVIKYASAAHRGERAVGAPSAATR